MVQTLPLIEPGKRAAVAGRTGSGKSTLARWLLERSPGHWLILNPKWTKAYSALPDSNTIQGINMKKLDKSLTDYRFTILNPTPQQSGADNLDDLVAYLHATYENIGLCVDELYTMHKNGQAGAGLIGWLTRGRELKQSFLGLTQRPSWVSKFLFSESDFVGEMSLNLQEDRKRMYEITGQPAMLDKLPPRQWLWYDAEADDITLYGAVPMPQRKSVVTS